MCYDREYFGPETTKNVVVDDDLTPEKRQENKREAKEIDTILNVLTNGTRSGSGEIVLEQFDLLNNIYGGARAKIPRSIDTFALFQVEFQVLNSQILNKVMLMKLIMDLLTSILKKKMFSKDFEEDLFLKKEITHCCC